MPIDYRQEAPQLLLDFLSYHETIKAHSQRTVDEYFLDLRNFFRYLKQTRDPALRDVPMDQISIRDEGRGIPKEEITNITKPFYMVDKSRSRKEGGAGIGMSLCQEIIRLQHAKWQIDSEVDHGTTITITFPDQNEKIKN